MRFKIISQNIFTEKVNNSLFGEMLNLVYSGDVYASSWLTQYIPSLQIHYNLGKLLSILN